MALSLIVWPYLCAVAINVFAPPDAVIIAWLIVFAGAAGAGGVLIDARLDERGRGREPSR